MIISLGSFKEILEQAIPHSMQLPLRFLYRKITGSLDAEMIYANCLLKSRRRFIDIGANVGIYTYFFSKNFQHIDAFEPLREITHRISNLKNKNITIHNVALSSNPGNLMFYVPIINGVPNAPLASLEKRDPPFDIREVNVKKLDDYGFHDVDFIKIDVEGHETCVIEGAIRTIQRTKPLLLIEIEQRHISRPINEVFLQIENLGYKGYFLFQGELIGVDSFSCATHQRLNDNNSSYSTYVHNFLFVSN